MKGSIMTRAAEPLILLCNDDGAAASAPWAKR